MPTNKQVCFCWIDWAGASWVVAPTPEIAAERYLNECFAEADMLTGEVVVHVERMFLATQDVVCRRSADNPFAFEAVVEDSFFFVPEEAEYVYA